MMIAFKSSNKGKGKLFDEHDLTTNPLYIRRMVSLVRDAIQKGSDVLQMVNGNIVITELKVITYQYVWNSEKGKFERAKSGSKSARSRRSRRNDESVSHEFDADDGHDDYSDDSMEDDHSSHGKQNKPKELA